MRTSPSIPRIVGGALTSGPDNREHVLQAFRGNPQKGYRSAVDIPLGAEVVQGCRLGSAGQRGRCAARDHLSLVQSRAAEAKATFADNRALVSAAGVETMRCPLQAFEILRDGYNNVKTLQKTSLRVPQAGAQCLRSFTQTRPENGLYYCSLTCVRRRSAEA
jgi:hypothetical protein